MSMSEREPTSQLREPPALVFPTEELVPESKRHLKLRTLLYQLLEHAFADRAGVGCDQFVYWDATDPTQCLAPDAFVRFGEPDSLFLSWKVWERGIPDVAVEIISESDERDRDWQAKLGRYRALGVSELVRFDPSAARRPLRVWDRVLDTLVERELLATSTPSSKLPGHWLVVNEKNLGPALRLSRDADGAELFLTSAEESARCAEESARRVQELEALLRQRG